MFFRRRDKQDPEQEPRAELPEDKRRLYRAPVDPDKIRVTVAREGRESVQAGVVNLSLEGAGIEIPFHLDPGFEAGEMLLLVLRHVEEEWRVETHASVEQLHPDGGSNVHYGLTFLNAGSLYAQLENTLGAYFNRRRHERVRPDLDRDVIVRLRTGGHRPRGPMHDLSESGMCLAVDLVAAVPLATGLRVEVAFELPGCRDTFEGHATVIAKRRLGAKEFVSIEFDLEAERGLREKHIDLMSYVRDRSEQMAAFSRALMATRTDG